jgi:hypothetical protein
MARQSQRQLQMPPQTKTVVEQKVATKAATTHSKLATKRVQAQTTGQKQATITEPIYGVIQSASGVKIVQGTAATATVTAVAPVQMISLKQSLDMTKIMLYSSVRDAELESMWCSLQKTDQLNCVSKVGFHEHHSSA